MSRGMIDPFYSNTLVILSDVKNILKKYKNPIGYIFQETNCIAK